MARLESRAVAGYFRTPDRVTAAIGRHLQVAAGGGKRVVRLLDPCAGEGIAASELAQALEAQSYGIELSADRAQACRERLDEVIHGSAFNTRIAHGAFSFMPLNPPYDSSGDEKRRLEHAFLTHMTRALCPGGVLVLIVPQRRLGISARYLSNQYNDITAYRFPDPEFEAFRQVVLFGVRKPKPCTDREMEKRIVEWSEGDLLELADEPGEEVRRYVVPSLPAGDVLFASAFFDPCKAAEEARARGAWANPQVREQLWPSKEQAALPLMPLRRGHLAMLVTAGFLNNMVLESEDQRLLVKGRAYKEMVEIPSEDEDTKVEREVVRTRVTTLDLNTGEVTDVGHGSGLSEFIEQYQEAIAGAVRGSHPPVYTAANRHEWGYDLTKLKRVPKGAQGDAIRAAAVSLQRNGAVTICGTMGTGKTLMGAAASWYASATAALHTTATSDSTRTIVVCPPHLVLKWKREVETTVPGARAVVVRTITDLETALRSQARGPLYVVLSREAAKLSYRWRPAVVERRWLDPREGVRKRLCCPGCGGELVDREGNVLDAEDLARKRRRCEVVLSPTGPADGCGEALWQAEVAPSRYGRGNFRFGDTPVGDSGSGPRRYAIADYVRKRCRGMFDTAIIDEVHEMKARGSAQGLAAAAVASSARRVIALTGTLYGGYSSTLFYLRYRFSGALKREFGYKDEAKWVSRYGILERITKYEGEAVGDGAHSKRREYRVTTVERPGVSPAVLFYLIGDTVFVRLEDVATDLPPYNEKVHLIPLDEESGQSEAYRKLSGDLYAALVAALASGSKRLLGAYLQALLSWPDACTREETVLDAERGMVLASAPALPADRLYPKEQALVDLCLTEKRRGRRVLIYVTHTGTRDITPRLQEVLGDAGLRVRVLKSDTVRAEKREDWVADRVREGLDVLICHPRLVQTGLDLVAFPTIWFHEPEYSVYTMRQASRRSWRIGQDRPVEVHFAVYADTLQQEALALVARKLKSALMVEGDLGDEGLSTLNVDTEDVFTVLARKLTQQKGAEGESLEALFAEVRDAEADRGEYLDEWYAEEMQVCAEQSDHASTSLVGSQAAEQADVTWEQWATTFAGGPTHTAGPVEALGGATGKVVTWEQLAALVGKPRTKRGRPKPDGQLDLFG